MFARLQQWGNSKYILSFFISLAAAYGLYHSSDLAPYGYPTNELSDNYWGFIISIAHKWRTFDFHFWDRGIGGGLSLFTCGQYPIFNPTNALAWVLDDNHFFLFKLIEPYFIGCFSMLVLLWDVFKVRLYIAIFGSLAYMGLTLSQSTAMVESPLFLLGCSLFPAMVLVFIKLSNRHIYLASAGIGALLAFQFGVEGVQQTPQMLLWWTIFVSIAGFFQKSFGMRTWVVSVLILWGINIGLWGIQLVPTYFYFIHESARGGGHYLIDNLSIWGGYPDRYDNLLRFLCIGFFQQASVRFKIITVLAFLLLGNAVMRAGKIFAPVDNRKFVYWTGCAIAIYLSISPLAGQVVTSFPSLQPFFNWMTYFAFRYGIHALDFWLVLVAALIINNTELSGGFKRNDILKISLAFLCRGFACWIAAFPMVLHVFPSIKNLHLMPFADYFKTDMTTAIGIFIISFILIFLFYKRSSHILAQVLLALLLIGIGYKMMENSYNYNGKGKQGDTTQFGLGTPEYEYYKRAQGKYSHEYESPDPSWMAYNYNLLFDVDGTSGFVAIPPKRLTEYIFYSDLSQKDLNNFEQFPYRLNTARLYYKGEPQESMASYFPIDFIVADKVNNDFPWHDFVKVIDGKFHDIYERKTPTERVYFADRLKVISLGAMIFEFNEHRNSTLYVVDKDAQEFGLKNEQFHYLVDPQYANFSYHRHEDKITFEVKTPYAAWLVLPEMFQSGWHLYIDHKPTPIFPAYLLFMGFQVIPGLHFIELRFMPQGLLLGSLLTISTIFLFIFLWFWFGKDKKRLRF